jgi:hypothetical protein
MSDSFTLAAYVIAVGALLCSFLFACHFPHCRCWKSDTRSRSGWNEVQIYELHATESAGTT